MIRVMALSGSLALVAIALGMASPASGYSLPEVGNCTKTLPNNQTCPDGTGPYFYADPDHCSMYYQCDDGCASHLLCQGDYLYDDKHQWCNFPQQVTCGTRDCDGRPCKPNPPPTNFTCPTDTGLFPDDDNCMKYFQCYEGTAEQKNCDMRDGKQLLYDVGNKWCDWPDRVVCGNRPICDKDNQGCTTQPPPPSTTTHQPNTCDTFGPCSAAQQGQMRSEGTCKQCFCECSATRWQQICCQPGLVFNPDKAGGQCDWPYNMPDCKNH